MLFILSKNFEVLCTIDSKGDLSKIVPYYDDKHHEILASGAETFEFTIPANSPESQHIVNFNHVAFMSDDGYKLFTISNVSEEHNDTFEKKVYCEMAGIELINEIVRPMNVTGSNLRQFLEAILSSTTWSLGIIDASFTELLDFEIKEYKLVYQLIQEYVVAQYNAEIRYRIRIENNKITGKFIDVFRQRGRNKGYRFEYSKNMESVIKTQDTTNLATALIGVGKNGLTFAEVEAADKPMNQDYIASQEAFDRWNINGRHIMGKFSCDSESAQELLKLTRKELANRINPNVKYEIKVSMLGDDVEIGDTVNIIDHEFNPPLYLEGRVSELIKSKYDPSQDSCVLSNYKEVSSNITNEMKELASQLEGYVESKFPIGTGDIKDDAVTADKIGQGAVHETHIYADSVTADKIAANAIKAQKIEAGAVTAEKIAANAIEADKIMAGAITTVKLNAGSVTAEKIAAGAIIASKIDAGAITAEKISAGAITADKIATGAITAGSSIITNGAIGSAQISKLSADKLDAGTIDASIVEISGTNGHLKIKNNRLQVFSGIGAAAIERVSLGDVDGDESVFGLRVRGKDGKTILLDENGVTNEGITDGAITNEKVNPNANIDGSKLNIKSVVTSINNGDTTISGTKISVGAGTLDAEFTKITNTQKEQSETIKNNSTDIKANAEQISLKVSNQTYQEDKKNMTASINKNSTDIKANASQIALKASKTDIETAIKDIKIGTANRALGTSEEKSVSLLNKENQSVVFYKIKSDVSDENLTVTFDYEFTNLVVPDNGALCLQPFYIKKDDTNVWQPTINCFTGKLVEGNSKGSLEFNMVIPEVKPDTTIDLRFRNDYISGELKISNLMITKGNKKVDWAPAPEDIETSITIIKEEVAQVVIDNKTITQRVETTENNIESLENASAQNLLPNSDFSLTTNGWIDDWNRSDSVRINLDTSNLLDGMPSIHYKITGETSDKWLAVYSPFIEAKEGQKFVASIYTKIVKDSIDNGAALEIEYYNNDTRITISSIWLSIDIADWQRVVIKGVCPKNTTKIRIRTHATRNGEFYVSKPMIQFGETVTGWVKGIDLSNISSKIKEVETKVSEDAITNTVKKNFYSKNEIDKKGYQTDSQVQQTVDKLEVKFQESGGYNLIYDGELVRGWEAWSTAEGGADYIYFKPNGLSCPNGKGVLLNSTLSRHTYMGQWDIEVNTNNKPFTVSYYTYVSSGGSDASSNAFRRGEFILTYSDGTKGYFQLDDVKEFDKWEKKSLTVKPTKSVSKISISLNNRYSTKSVYYSSVMVEYGEIATDWTPNPNETHDGIITIDKKGIKVSNSESNTHTEIDDASFRVVDNKGGTVAEFSRTSYIPDLTANIINANEIYADNVASKSPTSGSLIEIYVDGTYGNDDQNNGSYSSKYKTVQKAIDSLDDVINTDVTIWVYNSVPGFALKGKTGRGVINLKFMDSSIVSSRVLVEGITNRLNISNSGGARRATFKGGLSVYNCSVVDIYAVVFRGKNPEDCNIYIRDCSYVAVNECDLGGLSTILGCAIKVQSSLLWFYGCIGSNLTDVIGQYAFSHVMMAREGTTSKCPDYRSGLCVNYDGGGRIQRWGGGNYIKTPSANWNPEYTPTQKTQYWNFNKIWSDETLNGWPNKNELIQGYYSGWNTGRWTGYMQMTDDFASIRNVISGATNLSGRIYVQRTNSSGNSTGSRLCLYGSDGTVITTSQTINRGQGVWVYLSSSVIQKIQSGAIRYFYLKADSNNASTYFKCESNAKIEITYTK